MLVYCVSIYFLADWPVNISDVSSTNQTWRTKLHLKDNINSEEQNRSMRRNQVKKPTVEKYHFTILEEFKNFFFRNWFFKDVKFSRWKTWKKKRALKVHMCHISLLILWVTSVYMNGIFPPKDFIIRMRQFFFFK